MTKSATVAPTLLLDPFRTYDTAVRDLMQCYVGPKQESVPINFAVPRKEFASQLVVQPKNEEAQTNPRLKTTVAIPAMSVTRADPVFDSTRFSPNMQRLYLTADKKTWIRNWYPFPYIILYQIDAWTKYREHMNQIIVQTMIKFRKPFIALKVNWGEPYGHRNCFIGLDRISDTSRLESPVENQEREIRATMTLHLLGWVLARPVRTPSVLKVETDIMTTLIAADFADPTKWEFEGTYVAEGNTATGLITDSFQRSVIP